jgi:hypothetical protein
MYRIEAGSEKPRGRIQRMTINPVKTRSTASSGKTSSQNIEAGSQR